MKQWLLTTLLLGIMFAVSCTNGDVTQSEPTSADYRQQIATLEQQIKQLAQQVDKLSVVVSTLSNEVAPREVRSLDVPRFAAPRFLEIETLRGIYAGRGLSAAYWDERLAKAKQGLMGGKPTPEDVVNERAYYDAWLDYGWWLKQNNRGFVTNAWQIGDNHLSRLDWIQLQLNDLEAKVK